MPITQPSYPTRTDDLVAYLGGYVDTRLAVLEEAPVNVQAAPFNAVGDGATNTDGAAIKAACAAIKARTNTGFTPGRGAIYIPPGIYNLTVSLTASDLEGITI